MKKNPNLMADDAIGTLLQCKATQTESQNSSFDHYFSHLTFGMA